MQGALAKKVWIAAAVVALPVAAFGWWWKDARLEVRWEPDWPGTIRVAGEALERFPATAGGVTDGDRARAAERARWKAYYYAQLKVAERLGDLSLSAGTSIRQLEELDQELEASFQGTVRAAAEVESSVEYLSDAARARVVVEVPAESLVGFRTIVAGALRSGRISLERRPPVRQAPTSGPEKTSPQPAAAAGTGAGAAVADAPPPPEVADGPRAAPPDPEPATKRRPPRPRPPFSGAAVFLSENPGLLGPASVLYELGGTELGTVLDLPPGRLTAGFFPVATDGDAEAIHRLAGDSPRRYQATLSGRDLFLTESLASEEVRRFRRWLRAGKIVLVVS